MFYAKDVRKTYGSGSTAVRALRGVTLRLEQGEMVAVMGPSGCGKTTLLHVLSGIEPADEGEIWFNETALHQLKDKPLSDLRLKRMGFVFQQFHFTDFAIRRYPSYTGTWLLPRPDFHRLENACLAGHA